MALVLGAIAITLLVVLRQITAQRRNAALQAHFGALVEHASDVVLVVDAAGVIREASPSVAQTLGYHPAVLVGRTLAEFIAPDDQALVHADFAQITDAATVGGRPRPSAPCEWRAMHADGALRWLEVLCTNLIHDPAVRGVVINGRDVSERKALEIELTHQAYHGGIARLVNQARFRKLVEETLERRRPSDGEQGDAHADIGDRTSVAVLYIDLDEFKPVNDSLGHEAGDRVLEIVTERLLDATRGSTSWRGLAATSSPCCSSTFVTWTKPLPSLVAFSSASTSRSRSMIPTVIVGASIGIACTGTGGSLSRDESATPTQRGEVLLRDADEAMYLAKARGGRGTRCSPRPESTSRRSAPPIHSIERRTGMSAA